MVLKTPVNRSQYAFLLVGSLLGLVASFLQMIEKIALLKNSDSALPCDLGGLFSCSVVLSAPQSSLFGFPNALMCIVLFSMFTMLAIVGLTGGSIPKKLTHIMLGVAIFFVLFALWFLYTSTFVIGAVCIFCLVCFAGLLLMIGSLMRISSNGAVADGSWIQHVTNRGYDIMALVVLAMMVVVMIAVKFYIN